MYTSFGMIALAGFLAAPSLPAPQSLVWWRDYQVAQEKGAKEKKPLAVFVGAGQGGYHKLAQEGQLNDSITKVLAESYVCVYLDKGSKSQEELIKALAVTKESGLVLSDRTGNLQAYHHDGPLAQAELDNQLKHFANPETEVRSTLSNANQRYSYYPPSSPSFRTYTPSFSSRNC